MSSQFDLYEFPEGYSGRKSYVSVRGHARSVPSIYTYKGTDGRNYVHPDFGGDWSGYDNYSMAVQAPMFIRDIGEYRSPVDNSMITSRSDHREHLKRHGLVEVGTEAVGKMTAASTPTITPAERKQSMHAIKEHIERVKAMPEAHYQERIAKQQYEAVRD